MQAVECKEGLPIKADSHFRASISYQDLFRLYEKLSGMTVRPAGLQRGLVLSTARSALQC